MTLFMSKRQLKDLDNTIQQIKNPSKEQVISWLRHKGQAGRKDYLILSGSTKEEMANNLITKGFSKRDFKTTLQRVQRHIDHIRKEAHMIPLKEDIDGVEIRYKGLNLKTNGK
ncbi:MAG: hypothetical protein AB1585_07045 [Thermodesulfobacteriota bacterium]